MLPLEWDSCSMAYILLNLSRARPKNVEGIKDLYYAIGDRNLFLILEAKNMDGVNRILNQIKKVFPAGAVRMIGCRQLGIS